MGLFDIFKKKNKKTYPCAALKLTSDSAKIFSNKEVTIEYMTKPPKANSILRNLFDSESMIYVWGDETDAELLEKVKNVSPKHRCSVFTLCKVSIGAINEKTFSSFESKFQENFPEDYKLLNSKLSSSNEEINPVVDTNTDRKTEQKDSLNDSCDKLKKDDTPINKYANLIIKRQTELWEDSESEEGKEYYGFTYILYEGDYDTEYDKQNDKWEIDIPQEKDQVCEIISIIHDGNNKIIGSREMEKNYTEALRWEPLYPTQERYYGPNDIDLMYYDDLKKFGDDLKKICDLPKILVDRLQENK